MIIFLKTSSKSPIYNLLNMGDITQSLMGHNRGCDQSCLPLSSKYLSLPPYQVCKIFRTNIDKNAIIYLWSLSTYKISVWPMLTFKFTHIYYVKYNYYLHRTHCRLAFRIMRSKQVGTSLLFLFYSFVIHVFFSFFFLRNFDYYLKQQSKFAHLEENNV